MRSDDEGLQLSATDLAAHFGCRHLARLDRFEVFEEGTTFQIGDIQVTPLSYGANEVRNVGIM